MNLRASAFRTLVIDGEAGFTQKISGILHGYFGRRSISVTTDCVASIERGLLQMKYYDYDLALVSYRPGEGESALDFLELLERRKISLPVIVLAKPDDDANALDVIKAGAADFFTGDESSLARLPSSVDMSILEFRSSRERAMLSDDLGQKNRELKIINETLARQTVRSIKLKKEHERHRNKMESLLDAMVDGVIFINGDGEIEMLNPTAMRIFRFDEEGAVITLDDLVVFIGCDPMELSSEEEIPVVIFSRDYKITAIDVEEENSTTGRMLVLRDVTRDREVEKLKAEFQSMISHELRTPLTAISGAVDNFIKGNLGPMTEQQSLFLNMMQRNVARQMALINDMLDLARLEARMMSIKVSYFRPEYAARVSYENFRYAFEEKNIELSLEIAENLPKINADERMLTQILDNLLSNALKFTPKGGSAGLEVLMSSVASENAASILFRVTDSGIGIPDEQKEKIFDRYYQADSSATRTYPGTGLGLAICRKMAKLHNAFITCEDAEGGGAVFSLTLPVTMAVRKKIVLFADDPENRNMDEEVLGREFHLIALESAQNADKKMAKILPQLILIDYHMVAEGGLEIYSRIKNNSATRKIPVIFMGGHMTDREKIRALKMGASDIVERPYSAGEFLIRVKRVLEGIF